MLHLSTLTVAARDLLPGDIIAGTRVAEVDVGDGIVRVRFKDVWFEHPAGKRVEVSRGVVA